MDDFTRLELTLDHTSSINKMLEIIQEYLLNLGISSQVCIKNGADRSFVANGVRNADEASQVICIETDDIFIVTAVSSREVQNLDKDVRERLMFNLNMAEQKIESLVASLDSSGPTLTDRQIEVLSKLAHGKRTSQIAEEMNIINRAVDLHILEARKRLDATTREQAVARDVSLNLVFV